MLFLLEDVLQVHFLPLLQLLMTDGIGRGDGFSHGGFGLDEWPLIFRFDVGGLGGGEDFFGFDAH